MKLIVIISIIILSFNFAESQTVENDTQLWKELTGFLVQKNEITLEDKFSLFSRLVVESRSFKVFRFGVRGSEEREYLYFEENNKIEIVEKYEFDEILRILKIKFKLYSISEEEKIKITIEILSFLLNRIEHEESFILPVD